MKERLQKILSGRGVCSRRKAEELISAGRVSCNGITAQLGDVADPDVDAILLTGGLMRFDDIREQLEEYSGWVAPIAVYPGEYEMEALSKGVLRVLKGEEEAKIYSGKPVWDGFDWDQD
jgi:butyrate kinase